MTIPEAERLAKKVHDETGLPAQAIRPDLAQAIRPDYGPWHVVVTVPEAARHFVDPCLKCHLHSSQDCLTFIAGYKAGVGHTA